MVIADNATRSEIAETLAHFTHRAKRMTVKDEQYPVVHAGIDQLLDDWERAPV